MIFGINIPLVIFRLTAREITYNNFEISVVVFMLNITTYHAITHTKRDESSKVGKVGKKIYFFRSGILLT